MYKLSVPVSINTVTDAALAAFTETLRRAGAERIFLCGFFPPYRRDCYLYGMPDRIQYLITHFKRHGFEVGVWESTLGHGAPLAGTKPGGGNHRRFSADCRGGRENRRGLLSLGRKIYKRYGRCHAEICRAASGHHHAGR